MPPIVERPKQYRWNSLGYHVQTDNQDSFLSTDFGLKEFNVKSKKERIRRYRRYIYEAGSLNQPEKGRVKVIEDKILEKERSRAFELSKNDRFRYRTRYFTDSGIIVSKSFDPQDNFIDIIRCHILLSYLFGGENAHHYKY